MPGALPPTPTGLGSLSLAFAALRLRQSSIGLCGHQAKAAGLSLPFMPSTLLGVCRGGLGLQDWKQGLSPWAFWDSSGFFVLFLFCFCWDRLFFFRLQFLFSGAPLCGHYPQGYECWGGSHLNMRVGWVVSPGRISLRVLFLFYEGSLGTQRKLSCPISAVGGFWHFHLFQNLPSSNEEGCGYSHLHLSLPGGTPPFWSWARRVLGQPPSQVLPSVPSLWTQK